MYVQEAHAGDEKGDDEAIFGVPRNTKERRRAACELVNRQGLKAPVLVYDVRDSTLEAYGVGSQRLYVIDARGRVVYKSRPAPQDFQPEKIHPVLTRLLAGSTGEDPLASVPRPTREL